MKRFALSVIAMMTVGLGTSWGILITNSDLLPPNGGYRTPAQVHAEFNAPGPQTIDLNNILHYGFLNIVRVPCGGPAICEDEFFDSTVIGDLLINGVYQGGFQATGQVHIHVEGKNSAGIPFPTEMLSMNLTASSPFPGVLIRESPTLPSLGQTQIIPLGGPDFAIQSFFDVFVELSLDGGQTWIPQNNGPTRVELGDAPEPGTMLLLSSVLAGFGLRRHFAKRARAS